MVGSVVRQMRGLVLATGVLAAMAGTAQAQSAMDESSPWMIRLRGVGVLPQASGTINQVPGSNVSITNSFIPEADFSYFFTPNIAAELIAGVTPHHVNGAGSLAGVDVAKTWLLPPTLTLQYHFTNFGAFIPYVGAGVNYTVFFDTHAAGGTVNQATIKDTFGEALQVGADYMVDPHWGINFDLKKLFLRPDVSLNNGALSGNVHIDPWLVGMGVAYRF